MTILLQRWRVNYMLGIPDIAIKNRGPIPLRSPILVFASCPEQPPHANRKPLRRAPLSQTLAILPIISFLEIVMMGIKL